MSRFDDIDQETMSLLKETVAETAARSFPFLKFAGNVPEWKVGAAIVTDAEAIACVDEAQQGWLRFANKATVEDYWVLMLGNKKSPRPNSFTDKSKWPDRWPNGDPKDPWSFKTRLPLRITTGELAGRVVLFNGDNLDSRCAIGELQVAFIEKLRRPLVTLTFAKRQGENVYEPVFKIIRYTDDEARTPGLFLSKASTANEQKPGEPPQENSGSGPDQDDEIPF